jgi:hypothetical protein
VPGEPYLINFRENEVYECGATLLTLLACPRDDEQGSFRSDLHASLCAHFLWATHLSDPDDNRPISVKPFYVFRAREVIDRHTALIGRRLGERMVAARMAIPLLQEVALGHSPALPSSIKRLSINQLAEFVLEDAGQSDPGNVESRIWRPSLPVIHLAAAAAVAGQERVKAGEAWPEDYLHSPTTAAPSGRTTSSRVCVNAILALSAFASACFNSASRVPPS